jgi:hypothetical protein
MVAGFRGNVGAALVCAAALIAPAPALAAGPPLIDAAWVQQVTTTGVSMRMDLNPNGASTTYYFEYITDAAFQANPPGERFAGAAKTTIGKTSGSTFLEVAPTLGAQLQAGTVYHYRPAASNKDGSATVGEALEHIFVTKEASKAFVLPDGRAWEMVSPIDKGGGAIAAPGSLFGGGDLQAAAAGGAVTYGSGTVFGEAAGAPPVSQYVSRREGSAWITEGVSAPLESAAYGDRPDGAPYRLFSANLSRGLMFGGLACRGGLEACPAPNMPLAGSGAPADYMAYYLREGGAFSSLLTAGDVAHSALAPDALELAFAGAAPDLSHVVLSSCAALTADAVEVPGPPGHCDDGARNLYEWSASGLRAVNLLPGASVTSPGAGLAAPVAAVSEDGSRVYWTDGSAIYLREGDETASLPEASGGEFQAATPSGAFAFFLAGERLYRFVAATDASTDLTPSGGVVGLLGISADGETAYYQDASGLQRWHAGTTTTVAAGAAAAMKSDYPPATATARVNNDGLHLAFLSKASLTGFDNLDAATKLPDAELYVYGPPAESGASKLICASCNPTGERPQGPTSIPGSLVNGSTAAYRPRALSGDGSRVFFETADDLSDKDTDGAVDVYEWEEPGAGGCSRQFGCAMPISSPTGSGGTFVDASADAEATDVFFLTGDTLVKGDPGSIDLYDARVEGGLSGPPEEIVCVGDACQPLPGEPEDPTPGTLVSNPGNPPLHVYGPKRKRKHRRRHRHHHLGAGRRGRAHRAGGPR